VRPRSPARLGLIRRGLDQDPVPSKSIEKIGVAETDPVVGADLHVTAGPSAAEEFVDQDVFAVLGRHHRRKPEIASNGIEEDLLARSHELMLRFLKLSPDVADLAPQPTLAPNGVVCESREQQQVRRAPDDHVRAHVR